jgi:hypothetical protein
MAIDKRAPIEVCGAERKGWVIVHGDLTRVGIAVPSGRDSILPLLNGLRQARGFPPGARAVNAPGVQSGATLLQEKDGKGRHA